MEGRSRHISGKDCEMILFGSGNIGYQALQFIGEENVFCFCDNNPKVVGTERYGKEVVSFEDLKQKYYKEVIMICAGDTDSFVMAKQCEENGIFDYLIYIFMVEKFSKKEEFLSFMENPFNRMIIRKELYLRRIQDLESQVAYLKKHADIRYIKPARGELRDRQLKTVQISVEFFEKIKELEIKPILYGGNLLGFVRHHGFIPWDDDIDFALMRKEYEALKEYCKKYIYTAEEFQNKNGIEKIGEKKKQIADGMEEYYWIQYFDHFRVIKADREIENLGVDFFSLDYYAESYSFNEFMNFVQNVRYRIITAPSNEERIKCMEMALKENRSNLAEESDRVYFGIDNMDMTLCKHQYQWIPKDVIFPLKKAVYEGEEFWVPNQPEEMLKYEFERIWEFPEEVGIPRHFKWDQEEEET